MKRGWLAMMILGIGAHALVATQAQPNKGPMLPAVNPALAKLDVTITGLDGPGFGIAAGPGDMLVVGCERGTLQVFTKETVADFKSGKGETTVWKGHKGPVRVVAWTGGPVLASIGVDKKVNFWKMPEGKIEKSASIDFRPRAAAMTRDGKTLALAGEINAITLWDVGAGKSKTKLTDKMDWTLSVAFSPDGKQLLSGDYLGVVRLWDVAGAKKIAELPAPPMPPPKPPPDPVPATCVAFGPDAKTALIGKSDGQIVLVGLADGKVIRTFVGHTGPITGLALHPTGTLLASCSKDRTVKLWNPVAAMPSVQPLKSLDGHNAWIEGIVFIDQGTKLATVSADETVRIWDLGEQPKKK